MTGLRRVPASLARFTVLLIRAVTRRPGHRPSVVCVDDAGSFAIAVVGGAPRGRTNSPAESPPRRSTPSVLTTATDRLRVPALDQLPELRVHGALAAVTGALVSGRPVHLENELDWPLSDALLAQVDTAHRGPGPSVLVRDVTVDAATLRRDVVLVPRSLVVGIGTSSDATRDDVETLVTAAARCRRARGGRARGGRDDRPVGPPTRRSPPSPRPEVCRCATTPPRSFVRSTCPLRVPSSRGRGAHPAGGRGPAALVGAGPGATLVVAKQREPARPSPSPVGESPPAHLPWSAWDLEAPSTARPPPSRPSDGPTRSSATSPTSSSAATCCLDQDVVGLPIGAELDRAHLALERAAAGRCIVLVCSGDAGIYAPWLRRSSRWPQALSSSPAVDCDGGPRGHSAGVAAAAPARRAARPRLPGDPPVGSCSRRGSRSRRACRRRPRPISSSLSTTRASDRRRWQIEQAQGDPARPPFSPTPPSAS